MDFISIFLIIRFASAVLANLSSLNNPVDKTSNCLYGKAAEALITCNGLLAIFPEQIFFPNSFRYSLEANAIWSQESWKSPACVFSPFTAQDLASGIKILVARGTDFAIRSGGHMPVPGHNSFSAGGIMIATTHFTELTVVSTPNTVGAGYFRGGAAFRWQEVYEFLHSYGLFCIGGRDASIGSSLLLGGGLSYFSGFRGWAANNIVNVEMVLANSSIIQVNNRTAPDLFWALKGGTNNFGIITRYDLLTFPTNAIFGGSLTWAPENTQAYLNAQTAFILPGGGSEDPKAAIMPNFRYLPQTKQNTSGTVLVYDAPIENPPALENFTVIPTTFSSLAIQSLPQITNGTLGYAPRDRRWSFGNIAILTSEITIDMIFRNVVDNADSILPKVNCTVGSAIQPVTQNHLQAARNLGGDAIDLDPARGSFVIALIYSAWFDAADDEIIQRFTDATLASLEKEAKENGILYPWIFLNDAGLQQDPVATYGYGASAEKMKTIAKKYDPTGVFQKSVPGFKLTGEVHAC